MHVQIHHLVDYGVNRRCVLDIGEENTQMGNGDEGGRGKRRETREEKTREEKRENNHTHINEDLFWRYLDIFYLICTV